MKSNLCAHFLANVEICILVSHKPDYAIIRLINRCLRGKRKNERGGIKTKYLERKETVVVLRFQNDLEKNS